MVRPSILAAACVAIILGAFFPGEGLAAPGDTTWVSTFDQEFINWATPVYATFTLPPDPANWEKIIAFLTIECPSAPGDCDPWDRLGHLRIVTADQGDVEIMRFITPYDITGSGGPGSCTWMQVVTPYKTLLQDEAELRLYIESWIGGDRGWLISIDFAFIEGALDPEPYRVVNLWQNDWVEYGNPDDPLADHVLPMEIDVPAEAEEVEVRIFTTGHGQGNTDNCAEFCPKVHSLAVGDTAFSHTLWRSNCALNSCSPQLGTWAFDRAGWCPGDRSRPWRVWITDKVTPGEPVTLAYEVAAYENLCRPDTSCVAGVGCPDCNYNSTGHTVPIYVIQAQAIFYASSSVVTDVRPAATLPAARNALGENVPNPFVPETTFRYTIARPGEVAIAIYDVRGRLVREERLRHDSPGSYTDTWDGRNASGRDVPAGVYFYRLRVDGEIHSRKMIRLR